VQVGQVHHLHPGIGLGAEGVGRVPVAAVRVADDRNRHAEVEQHPPDLDGEGREDVEAEDDVGRVFKEAVEHAAVVPEDPGEPRLGTSSGAGRHRIEPGTDDVEFEG